MPIERISPEEAQRRLDSEEGWTYIDVRDESEFEQAHVAGSKNVPVLQRTMMGMTPNEDFVSVVEANFAKDAKLVIGCLRGGRSMRAAMMLESAGFVNCVDMRGGLDGEIDPATGQVGYEGWARRGLPVTTETADGESYEHLAANGKSDS